MLIALTGLFLIYQSSTILENLLKNYKIEYQPSKNGTHLFPKAAGDKINFPYFKAFDKNVGTLLFQICPGSKVLNKYNHEIHPDISFQKPLAGDIPTGTDLILIVDAKHKGNSASRVTSDDVKVFAVDVINYEIDPEHHSVNFASPLDTVDKSAIFTNGKPHLDTDGMLSDFDCILVHDFYPGSSHQVLR